MLAEFAPIVHRFPAHTIKVYAIADVHIGARECDMDGFETFIHKVANEQESYIVLVGDIINNSIRSADCPTDIYDELMPPAAQVDKAAELLAPVAGKILGAVGGNHELRSRKAVDYDPMRSIMTLLRREDVYRENMAFMRIVLQTNRIHDSYALLLVHGKSANKKRRFAYAVEGVDAVISGHTHNGVVEKPARLVFTQKNNVVVKPLVSLTATSWLNYGGYGARGLYLPNATSSPQALILESTHSNNSTGQIKVVW